MTVSGAIFSDPLTRLLVLGIALIVAFALVFGIRLLIVRLAGRQQGNSATDLLSGEGKGAVNGVILYFSTPGCADCRIRQKPVLSQLAGEFGDRIEVRHLNALEENELVKRFTILTVPSTVVLAPDGKVRAVNYGFADFPTLQGQLVL